MTPISYYARYAAYTLAIIGIAAAALDLWAADPQIRFTTGVIIWMALALTIVEMMAQIGKIRTAEMHRRVAAAEAERRGR